ncbi:MAG: glycosyltransferase family 4 protein [Flavobacteriales bacterium]|nr:glycosyltransferase family 4 protein [Flavobacteriales bacterium]
MNILFISTNDHMPWGGSEVLWTRAALAMAKRGHRVTASVRRWDPRHKGIEALAQGGVVLHERERVALDHSRWQKAWAQWRQGFVRQFADNRWSVLDQQRPDLAVISLGDHLDEPFLQYAERLLRMQVPYVVVVQLVHPYADVTDELAERFIKAYAGARQVVFVSEQNRAIAELQLGHIFTNAVVVPNPIDAERAEAPLAFPSTGQGHRLAMVGALTPFHKGHDVVLQVMARPKWKQRELYVDLFGDGRARNVIERNIKALGIERVRLCGYEPDKQVIWGTHHAALFASRMEGLSLALLEAMAFGRPVIATTVGDAQRFIRDGENGYLATPGDADALDAAMERAWENRSAWQTMGSAAFETFARMQPTDPVQDLVQLLERPA